MTKNEEAYHLIISESLDGASPDEVAEMLRLNGYLGQPVVKSLDSLTQTYGVPVEDDSTEEVDNGRRRI